MTDILDFQFNKETPTYKSREALVQSLYVQYGPTVDDEALYSAFQNVDESIGTDITQEQIHGLKSDWKNVDRYWWYVNRGGPEKHDLIKVYATPRDRLHVAEIYAEAVSILLDRSEDTFFSKVSRRFRDDPLCFWVSRKDYFRLEKFFEPYDLETPLPFVPFRGNLGISKELTHSYNGTIARLMKYYFASEPEVVNLKDMYSLLVRYRRGELLEDHPMEHDYYGWNSIRTVMVLLKSSEALLNEEYISDNHILLKDDLEMWWELEKENPRHRRNADG